MRKLILESSTLAAMIAVALWPAGAHAQAPASAPAASAASVPARIAAERITIAGQVTALDREKRDVTLRTDDGQELNLRVDPSLTLERVKVGDRVTVDYAVAIALALKKGGGEVVRKVEEEAAQNQVGERGGVRGRRTTVVADVLSVDRDKSTVRLRGPQGRVVDAKVADKSRLDEVRTGDQVVAVVDEALAVNIQPSSAQGAAPSASSASSPAR